MEDGRIILAIRNFNLFVFIVKVYAILVRGAAKGGSTRSLDLPVLIVVGPGRSRSDFSGSDSYFLVVIPIFWDSESYFLGSDSYFFRVAILR